MTQNVYIIDASSLIDLHQISPISVFTTLWDRMAILIREKRLVSPEAVREEIERKDDELLAWVRANPKLFKKRSGNQMRFLKEILREYPHLSVEEITRNADALIVALALELSKEPQRRVYGVRHIVVTEEVIRGNRVKIPSVCKKYGIDTIGISDMFKAEGWKI